MSAATPGAEPPVAVGHDPLAKLRWAMAQAERMAAQQAPADAERAARTAEAARRGELGAEWQRVQQRVDRGETTLADVFGGRDTSPDAAALARRSHAQMSTLLGSAAASEEASLGEAFDALEELRARIATALGDVSASADDAAGTARPAWLEQP